MGLIAAALSSVSTTLADTWKEFFYCDSLDKDTLVVKGQKRVSSKSSNTKGSDNIISNGSGIAVADGQCMIIVDQGKIVEFCAEAGEYKYDTSTEPSLFSGSLGTSLIETFKVIGKRISYGGDTGKDQRVYYFNTKEILDNKFGTANPIMFNVIDNKIGLDLETGLRCNGIYTYKLINPLLFYANICGNVTSAYKRSEIDSTLKMEFISALQPALAKISALGLRPSQIPAHTEELASAMKEVLSEKWRDTRGIEVQSVSLGAVTIPEEDAEIIKTAQKNAMLKDPSMAAATIASAQAEAMKAAASNTSGAMNGFIGMNMASQAGGVNASDLFAMAAQQKAQAAPQQAAPQQAAPQQAAPQQAAPQEADGWKCPNCGKTATGKFCPECGTKKPEPKAADSWVCPSCGKTASGKFCTECGTKKPADEGWTCSCGTVNKGKFCSNCGAKKPEGAKLYKCDKCGWEPEDPSNPPKFCPECGDLFDDHDIQ